MELRLQFLGNNLILLFMFMFIFHLLMYLLFYFVYVMSYSFTSVSLVYLIMMMISSWESLSEILTIANLWHAASRIWTCTELEFRLNWMKLCRSDNHHTTASTNHANIWDGASVQNIQWFLAVDCFYRELHLGCLHWLKRNKLLRFICLPIILLITDN